MQDFQFTANSKPTIGIELELALVDEETMKLSSSIETVLEQLGPSNDYKPELMQCCLEVITGVCNNVEEAGDDLREKLTRVEEITDNSGLRLWWGATHPFSPWRDQQVTPDERYQQSRRPLTGNGASAGNVWAARPCCC